MVFSIRSQNISIFNSPNIFPSMMFTTRNKNFHLQRSYKFFLGLCFLPENFYLIGIKIFPNEVFSIRSQKICTFSGPKIFPTMVYSTSNFHLQRPKMFPSIILSIRSQTIFTFSGPRIFPSMMFSTMTQKFPPSPIPEFFQVCCFEIST